MGEFAIKLGGIIEYFSIINMGKVSRETWYIKRTIALV